MDAALPATRVITVDDVPGCRDRQYSELSRFWELETGTDCGTFGIRGYRPISLSLVRRAASTNNPPRPTRTNNATTVTPYRNTETRLQLSVRTKIASGLLTRRAAQLSATRCGSATRSSRTGSCSPADLSRPFRNTDHEPEVIYIYPTDAALPGGWRLRYSGVGAGAPVQRPGAAAVAQLEPRRT